MAFDLKSITKNTAIAAPRVTVAFDSLPVDNTGQPV